jgi:hypothetical protein
VCSLMNPDGDGFSSFLEVEIPNTLLNEFRSCVQSRSH